MTPEARATPAWAQRKRQGGLDWINQNMALFSTAAKRAHPEDRRGAIVVDTTAHPISGVGKRIAYFPQDLVEQHIGEYTQRMVAEYDPEWKLVLVLLKSDNRTSTYRVGVPSLRRQEPEASEVLRSGKSEPRPGSRLKAPAVETLIGWEADGACEGARRPPVCDVEILKARDGLGAAEAQDLPRRGCSLGRAQTAKATEGRPSIPAACEVALTACGVQPLTH